MLEFSSERGNMESEKTPYYYVLMGHKPDLR